VIFLIKKKKKEEKMSFLSKNSMECAKSELDLFAVPPTQTSIESARIVEYNSDTQANDGPLHFVVVGVEGEYVDLSQTYIYVKAKITTAKGDDITQENVVGPSNLLLHTMFSQVDVSVRNQKITNSVYTYPYRCMFETLLNYGSDAKESHLTLIRSGNVRIELKFGEALAAAICCIVYMEYESIMKINKTRNVMLVDFII
jgi:hypothetical protein